MLILLYQDSLIFLTGTTAKQGSTCLPLAVVLALPFTTDIAPKALLAVLASVTLVSDFVLQFNLYADIPLW